MYILYNGNESGSWEIRLIERVHPALWQITKRQAIKALNGVMADYIAGSTLEALPLELWRATNGFGDAFNVLYMKVPVQEYLKLETDAEKATAATKYEQIARALDEVGIGIRFISMDPEDSSSSVSTPQLEMTSATVERALSDFETLLHSKGGAVSGVDRIHTALQAYLIVMCRSAGIEPGERADMTALFSLVRNHPKLKLNVHGVESAKVLRGLAQVVDALNPVRNSKSLAHPNEELLEEAEAMLVVNAARTLLHYLNSKLK
jgi:hypothetical protein